MHDDTASTIAELKRMVKEFSRERDWEQFHHPKDLGVALMCEVGELVEHFRYRNHDEILASLAKDEDHRAFAHELADCFWLILRLADVCKVDLASALAEKLSLAAKKYPAALVRGKPHKYTYYQNPQTPETNEKPETPDDKPSE